MIETASSETSLDLELKGARYDRFEDLDARYSEVFEKGARSSFFLTPEWFRNFAVHVMAGTPLRIYGVENRVGRAVALLPLCVPPRNGAKLKGRTIESLSNYYSCNFAPVIRDDSVQEESLKLLARQLWDDRRDWDVLKIQPLNRNSKNFDGLVQALKDAGMVVQTYFCFGNWYLELAGRSYAQYVQSLSSALRKNIPYNERRLEKLGNSRITIHTTPEGLDAALDSYEAVYKSSWKIPEASPGFIRSFAADAAQRGWLRLGLIHIGDKPAAAQLWIVHDGTASIYKIAYDEEFAKLSVGSVLTARLMRRVIDEDGVQIVDYLSGDDEYKKIWMSHRREFWGLAAFNPRSAGGLLQIGKNVGGRYAKRMLEAIGRKKNDKSPG